MNKITLVVGSDQIVLSEDTALVTVIEVLTEKRALSHDTYDIFIHEERNFGSIPFELNGGKFEFPFMSFSDVGVDYKPSTIEEEMYFKVYSTINHIALK